MIVREITDEGGLNALRPEWNALLAASASDTIFLTWEWVSAWWSSYGEAGALRVLAAYDDAGALCGLAPLRTVAAHRMGRTSVALEFVGDGSNDSEYLDFIAPVGREAEVMKAFTTHLAGDLDRGAVLLLNELPGTSPNLERLREHATATHALFTESDLACGTMPLPAVWETYVSSLKPRFRTRVRSVLRDLEGRPGVSFRFCSTQAEVERLLPDLFDLHTRRWERDGKPGVFGWDKKRVFYSAVSALLLERGWLRFSCLEWNDRVLACQYGFAYRGTYFHLQEGYEPDCEHWNPGIGLRAWTIREFISQGLTEYDFLGGVKRHKTDWGAVTKYSKQIQLAAPSFANSLFCHGPEWKQRMREKASAALPEKLHAVRRALIAPEKPHVARVRDWVGTAAANCYHSLGMPALLRPLRERVEGRSGPSARILYYHRVNNDGDPFFPAHSTEVFERHMRYVARYYPVVTLSEALAHVAHGPSRTVVAITFDDGYQDNYHHALPILRRYHLPATIFLATGSLDTREPLWFERLAGAVKHSPHESIDFETDLPRRYWLRNEAERLEANDRLFELLRRMPENERTRRLDEILHLLSAPASSERRDVMLTWDQAREMRRHGIDFGAHTVTHPFLSRLPRDRAGWEVCESKRRIEEELQAPADFFAYPNGRGEDIADWNRGLLAGAGYRGAVTTNWGLNYASTDPLALRRGGPWEESAAMFASKLDWYQFAND